MSTELLPCPFCGGEAQVMHMELDSIEEGWKVWGVWCMDDLHAEEHGGYQHGHFIDNFVTEAEAIAAWNTRAERTCEIKHIKSGAMYDVWRCSACGYEYAESVSDMSIVGSYCPNCGAKAAD